MLWGKGAGYDDDTPQHKVTGPREREREHLIIHVWRWRQSTSRLDRQMDKQAETMGGTHGVRDGSTANEVGARGEATKVEEVTVDR